MSMRAPAVSLSLSYDYNIVPAIISGGAGACCSPRQTRGNSEAVRHTPPLPCPPERCWLYVLVDQAVPMTWPTAVAKPMGNAPGSGSARAVAPGPDQGSDPWLAARVLEYEDRPSFVTRESLRLGRPRGSRSAASEYSCSSRLRLAGIGCSEMGASTRTGKGLRGVAAAVKDELPAFSQRSACIRKVPSWRASLTNASPPQRTPLARGW